jgi:hypothetical protein
LGSAAGKPEIEACPLLIVRTAAQRDPGDRMRPRPGPGVRVVELEELLRVAAPAIRRDIGATAAVALRYRAADRGVSQTDMMWWE